MDLVQPLCSVVPGTRGRVLTVLASTDEPLSGQRIAKLAGLSTNGALAALGDLIEAGIVWRAKLSASSFLHLLNREHLATPAILALAGFVAALRERVAEHVDAWDPAPAAVAIRAPGTATDDVGRALIDLLVVVDEPADGDWRARINELAENMWHWTGNRTHPTTLALDEAEAGALMTGDTEPAWILVTGRELPGLSRPVTGENSGSGRRVLGVPAT